MTARLELADERYTIERGVLTPEDADDPVQKARAKYLSTIGPMWLSEMRHQGTLGSYDPDPDCTLAQEISRRLNGRARCRPPAPPRRGVVY